MKWNVVEMDVLIVYLITLIFNLNKCKRIIEQSKKYKFNIF